MAATKSKLVIASWNSRGHSDNRLDYMEKLLQNVDILLVQEHWHYENNIVSMVNSMNDIQVYGTSSMDANVLQTGRPHGGCAFMYNKYLKFNTMHVTVDSNRCCAMLCVFPNNVKILIFNIYMPCDTDHDQANLAVYLDVLYKISHVRSDHPDVNHTIIAGDLNTEMTRRNSLHTVALEDFMNNE